MPTVNCSDFNLEDSLLYKECPYCGHLVGQYIYNNYCSFCGSNLEGKKVVFSSNSSSDLLEDERKEYLKLPHSSGIME